MPHKHLMFRSEARERVLRGAAAIMPPIISLVTALLLLAGAVNATPPAGSASLLETNLLVTWYGNPHSAAMGILGRLTGAARAEGLRRQAAAYIPLTRKRVRPAYHLVTVVAQPTPGRDKTFRRRESTSVIQAIVDDARANGFVVVLDVQLGHAAIDAELEHLRPFLRQPDVHLALDPEFDMSEGQVPGRQIGHSHADDVNTALDVLDRIRAEYALPPKVLIVHQFTLAMLPDKARIRPRAGIDLVLNMDGFGAQALKVSSYRAVMRQHALPFAGMKLFYRQDVNLFTPAQVMGLTPAPAVVIYQ